METRGWRPPGSHLNRFSTASAQIYVLPLTWGCENPKYSLRNVFGAQRLTRVGWLPNGFLGP